MPSYSSHLFNGGCIANGVDAASRALHSQVVISNDRAEVRLTVLEPVLQLQAIAQMSTCRIACATKQLQEMRTCIVAT